MSEKATYEVGKGKPPKNRRFGQPEGNPNGKTAAQKKAEMKAAEIAKQLEARLLAALAAQSDAMLVETMTGGDITRLIKTAMDREYGTATQKVEASGAGGGPLTIHWKNADN
jgi:hypothetical protein